MHARNSMLERDPVIATLLALVATDRAVVDDAMDLDDIGWKRLLAEAFRHGVAPIAWTRLREAGRGASIPSNVARDFARSYCRAGIENLRLYERLARVLRRFAEEGLDVIVLKGAFLADVVYRNRALRWMSDADLLVHRYDLARATSLLVAEGWRQPMGGTSARVTTVGHQLPTFALGGARLDVHWNIEDEQGPFCIDIDGVWDRAQRVSIAGISVLGLAPEDLLLHLCLHTCYSHGWLQFAGGLRHLSDIAATTRHYEKRLDWEEFALRAGSWRGSRCAWLALVLAKELLGAAVPAATLDRLAPCNFDRRLTHTARYLALGSHYAEITRVLPVLAGLWLNKRWPKLSVAGRCWAALWPSQASLAASYPSLGASHLHSMPMHQLAHLADLAREWTRTHFAVEAAALRARERDRWALLKWLESSTTAPANGVVTFRRATLRDCEAVAETNVRSWRESFAGIRPQAALDTMSVPQRTDMYRRRFTGESYHMFVAEVHEHGVIGFVDVGRARQNRAYDAELYAIYIRKAFQRHGLGTSLFELAINAAIADGMDSLCLIVLADSPYRAFYEKLGGCLVAEAMADAAEHGDSYVTYAWKNLRRMQQCRSNWCQLGIADAYRGAI
jgi:GNAT superfamily N-acetyltransferase